MAADIEVLIFHGFPSKKRHFVISKVMGPHLNLFQSNETWHIHCGMSRLHRSNNGLLAQELVSGQQTSKYRYSLFFEQKEAPWYI